jgi:hypothetical protein
MTDDDHKPETGKDKEGDAAKPEPERKRRPFSEFLLRIIRIMLVACLVLLLFVAGLLVYSVFVVQGLTVSDFGTTQAAGFVLVLVLLFASTYLLISVSRLLRKIR